MKYVRQGKGLTYGAIFLRDVTTSGVHSCVFLYLHGVKVCKDFYDVMDHTRYRGGQLGGVFDIITVFLWIFVVHVYVVRTRFVGTPGTRYDIVINGVDVLHVGGTRYSFLVLIYRVQTGYTNVRGGNFSGLIKVTITTTRGLSGH